MLTKVGISKAISGEMEYITDQVRLERYYECKISIKLRTDSTLVKIKDLRGDVISEEMLPEANVGDEINLGKFKFLTKQIIES